MKNIVITLILLIIGTNAMAYEELFLKSSDNTSIAINKYYNHKKEALIIAPGWFMTKDSHPFKLLAGNYANDFDVIVMDFRGHGRSNGFYTFSAKEDADLKSVIDYARIGHSRIYIIGFSLGGAVAAIEASKNPYVDKLILVSTPCDFNKIENQMWKKTAWLPTIRKFEPKRWLSIRPSLKISKKTKPETIIAQIKAPTLFITGDCDPTVHLWHSRVLFKNATCEKKLLIYENANHAEDLFLDYPLKFMTDTKTWLKPD